MQHLKFFTGNANPELASAVASRLGIELGKLPSRYLRDHFTATFIVDKIGVQLRHAVGVGSMAWSTDFPHHGCDWPYSRKVIQETMGDVAPEEMYWILAGNMVRLYDLPQALPTP